MNSNYKIDISVVIPVYNSEKTIADCVNSVIKEIEHNSLKYEIILVNDGSKDSSLQLCNDLSKKNERIKVYSQENAGPSAARNFGIRCATGEFLAFNDSDDVWLDGKVNRQISYLKDNPRVDMVCAKYNSNKRLGHLQELTYRGQVFYSRFSPQTSIFRRKTLNDCFFPEDMRYAEDAYFVLNYMKNHVCVYMPKCETTSIYSKCSFGESGLSANLLAMTLGGQACIKYVYNLKKIDYATYLVAILWSWLRYFRRKLLTFISKKKNTK